MKKLHWFFEASFLLLLLFFSGCIKDSVQRTYTYTLWRPLYKTTMEARADIKSNAAEAVHQPGKLFIKGNYIFLNEVNKGVHVIDNSNPAQPLNVAFIDIPGNVDLAVNGNVLYADLYTDLVAIDITNPLAAKVTKVVEGVFPHRFYSSYFSMDSSQVIVDWIKKDTTVTEKYDAEGWNNQFGGGVVFVDCWACAQYNSDAAKAGTAAAPTGISGSMARFTIAGNRLYSVGEQELNIFNIANAAEPTLAGEKQIGFGIETIYPFKDKLFVGSTNGMFIYNISNPDQPEQLSQFTHVQSCDPVIADDNNAYVTLRSGNACQGFTNQLEVLDISNLLQPSLIKTYPMTNPYGLSKDGNLLFICDGVDGVKVYDAANPNDIKSLTSITGLTTYDVIAYNGLAIVVAQDGLYQFDYRNPGNIRQLSKLTVN